MPVRLDVVAQRLDVAPNRVTLLVERDLHVLPAAGHHAPGGDHRGVCARAFLGGARNAVDLVQRLSQEIGARSVAVTESIAKVSLIGVGMRSHSGVAAKMFEVLSREGVNIMMISTSEIKISCVIEEKYLELAMRTLHTAFGLDRVSAPALG